MRLCDYSLKIKRFLSKCSDYKMKIVIVPEASKHYFLNLKDEKIDEMINFLLKYYSKQESKKGLGLRIFDVD